jgi:hypothetical protein
MPASFRTSTVTFDSAKGGSQTRSGTAVFGSTVLSAGTAIQAFELGFTDGDHHIYQEKVSIKNVQNSSSTVTFDVEIALRDNSGNYDDPFKGQVVVQVSAEVAA